MPDKKKSDDLKYGEGQREQYGEGQDYRPEDKSEGADTMDEAEFGGGEHKSDKGIPDGKKPDKAR